MIGSIPKYILWALIGIGIGIGILLLIILSHIVIGFFTKKSTQQSQKSQPDQGDTKTALGSPANNYSRTPRNTVDDSRDRSYDLKPLLQVLTKEIQGIRESLNQIAEILQSQVSSQPQDIKPPFPKEEKILTPRQGMTEPPQLPESETGEQVPPFLSQEVEEPVKSLHSVPSERMPPALTEFCDLYNGDEQGELQRYYQPHYRVGVVNAMERRQDISEPPLFENRTSGKFLVHYIEEEDLYAVVPSYGLVLERLIYGPGAFGEVFDCPEFDSQSSYTVKVIQPARFEPDYTKKKWTLKEKGKLKLEVCS